MKPIHVFSHWDALNACETKCSKTCFVTYPNGISQRFPNRIKYIIWEKNIYIVWEKKLNLNFLWFFLYCLDSTIFRFGCMPFALKHK